jgi:integrase
MVTPQADQGTVPDRERRGGLTCRDRWESVSLLSSDRRVSIHARQLKSGKKAYDVKLRRPNGKQYTRSFRSLREAQEYQRVELSSHLRGSWADSSGSGLQLSEYAREWLELKVELRPRTIELYEWLLRVHIVPALGATRLHSISPQMVRRWHASLRASSEVGGSTAAKAYRLLHAVLATAVEDELLRRNPCAVRRAGIERAAERPVATIDEIAALADAIEPRYRATVLLAAWAGLRYGELAGLQRRDLDPTGGTVRVERQLTELRDGSSILGPPKTDAGRRLVAIPPHILRDLVEHLAKFVGLDPTSPVFTTPEQTTLRRSNFNRRTWRPACEAVGIPPTFRFHDLRHTHNTLAAMRGASTRELMSRMGHSSPRAAPIYQHATSQRDRTLANSLAKLVENGGDDQSGAAGEDERPSETGDLFHGMFDPSRSLEKSVPVWNEETTQSA